MDSNFCFLPAQQIAKLIRRKEVSAVEAAQAHLDRIERLNPKLNAFVDWHAERIMQQAQAADVALRRSEEVGPLHGVPISIKSSIDVEAHRCEAGSRLRAGYIAKEDAPLVARLRAAGAVILGMTNTPEFLMAWETDNLLYGRTNNPWNLQRTAGGSSGGEAAAIASGMSAGGVGSDGGGSIRVPAHFCGICGLKPTPGRIPSTGHFPKAGGPFALLGVVGPMARTIEDVRVLFEVMEGWDDCDPCAAPVAIRKIDEKTVESCPIGFSIGDGRTPVTEETCEAVRGAAFDLANQGFRVEEFRPDSLAEDLEEAQRLWWEFFGVAGGMILEPTLRGRENDLSPILREFCGWAKSSTAHTRTHTNDSLNHDSLLNTWLERDALREKILQHMRKHPVLVCPVASVPAFLHGEREWQIDGKTVKYLDAWSYCEWFNLLGFPAAVVPAGYAANGLPIGVQIVGRPWEEELVLAIAARLDQPAKFRPPREL